MVNKFLRELGTHSDTIKRYTQKVKTDLKLYKNINYLLLICKRTKLTYRIFKLQLIVERCSRLF